MTFHYFFRASNDLPILMLSNITNCPSFQWLQIRKNPSLFGQRKSIEFCGVFSNLKIVPNVHLFSIGLKCHTFTGLNMTRDCRIYLYVRLVRIDIQQYNWRFAYSSRHFINLVRKPRFVSSLDIWSSCPLKLLLNKSSFPLNWRHTVVSGVE